MTITCVIKLDFKIRELYLLVNDDEKLFTYNNFTQSYNLEFNYKRNTKLIIRGIKTKNTGNFKCVVEFSRGHKSLSKQTFKIENSGQHFQFEIKNFHPNINDNDNFRVRHRRGGNSENPFRMDYSHWVTKSNTPPPKTINESILEIFFGTNRKKTNSTLLNEYFGNEMISDNKLNVGKCYISIPDCHEVGKVERPLKIWKWSARENQNKHILLHNIEELDETIFYNELREKLAKESDNSFLLFVHGYNNSFEETAWRTGQIAYDLSFKGLTGFFSWPSAGKILGYARDRDMADASASALARFINSIIDETNVEKVHIIAHSMGNIVVTSALKHLSLNTEFRGCLPHIEQIVLAAPDIDQNVFKNEILPTFKTIGKNRTMYVSDKDNALRISEVLRAMPRLGQGGKAAFTDDDFYTIDASNVVSPGNHHSYIFDTKPLLTDLFFLLDGVANPLKRNLKKNAELWYFPK